MSNNLSLLDQERDLLFYASRGLDKNYFEIFEEIKEQYKNLDEQIRIKREERIINNTLLSLSIESKNNSPIIAKHIIEKVNEKTLLNSILYCIRTKEIYEEMQKILNTNPEEIINGSIEIDVEIAKKEISKIISNSNSMIEIIAQKTKENVLQKLPTESKKYIIKKLPNLCIFTPKEIIENKLLENNKPSISLIEKDLIKYLEEEFKDFNQKNREHEYEIYLGDFKLENDHIMQIIVLSYQNKNDQIVEFKIILDKHEFLVLMNNHSKNHFKAIGNTKLDSLRKIITKQIFNQKTIQ